MLSKKVCYYVFLMPFRCFLAVSGLMWLYKGLFLSFLASFSLIYLFSYKEILFFFLLLS